MPELAINQFRAIAETAGHFERQVKSDDGGKMSASTNFLGRLVNWIKGGPSEGEKAENRQMMDTLVASVRGSYGDVAANSVQAKLATAYAAGKPLTDHAIKDALVTAKANLTICVGTQQIRALSVARELPAIFKESTGSEINDRLSQKDQFRLEMAFHKAVRNDPRGLSGGLSTEQMKDIAERVIGEFEPEVTTTKFEQQFSHLATLMGDKLTESTTMDQVLSHLQSLPDGPQKQQLQTAVANMGPCMEILTSAPAGREETEQHLELIDVQLEVLQSKLEEMDSILESEPEGPTRDAALLIRNELGDQIENLEDHQEYLQNFLEGDPLSGQAMQHANDVWTDSAIQVLQEGIDTLEEQGKPDEAGKLIKLLVELTGEKGKGIEELDKRDASIVDASGDKSAMKDAVKDIVKSRPKELEGRVKAAFEEVGLPTKHLKEELHHAHIDVLNRGQEWSTISSDLRFVHKGQVHQAHSEINPAAQMGDIFASRYDGEGINCATTDESVHAVNLATTKLEDSDGHVVFQGVRHAVHCAFGLEEGDDRIEANDNRAKESVVGALSMDPDLMARALAGEEVDLSISSISLMTPDNFRGSSVGKLVVGDSADERTYVREQLDTWKRLGASDKQPIEIQMRNPDTGELCTVKIKLDVAAFNFGVNEGAVKGKFGMDSSTNFVGGWDNVRADNEAGLEKLFGDLEPGTLPGGRVAKFLAREDVPDSVKNNVRQLTEQVRGMWKDGSYMKQGHEPYKLAARVAVLTHMMEDVPMWNCKSGKDRTGMLDGEAKLLAMRIQLLGRVPTPDEVPGPEEQAMIREFLLRTGNLEMQQMNTGIKGFKTEGVDAIDERIGSTSARETHRGGSAGVSE